MKYRQRFLLRNHPRGVGPWLAAAIEREKFKLRPGRFHFDVDQFPFAWPAPAEAAVGNHCLLSVESRNDPLLIQLVCYQ
jgi:hypothetical protein